MDEWFETIKARRALSDDAARELDNAGFTVVPGFKSHGELARLAEAYDVAMASAGPADLRIGSKTTRVNGLVNCGPEFDDLYLYPPLLEACCRTIRRPFRLSTMLARTLRPYADTDDLHQDFARDDAGWTMIGFIIMIDEFCPENGATQFVPGSHRQSSVTVDLTGPVPACGPAGSIIVYNGSVWHGHSANSTAQPRRSIQGAFIRRREKSGTDLPASVSAETSARIGEEAKYVLAL
jgi:Phytanoyl-CoA dioxygenase (PhyH)